MTALAPTRGVTTLRSELRRASGRVIGLILLIIAGAAIAYGTINGHWLTVFGLMAVIAALVVGIHNWRWSIYALLLYLPFSGLPTLLTYPNTQIAVLIKDILFVVPAYVGFALVARRQGWRYPGSPVILMCAFVFLVLVQSINSANSNPLVALIGMKVWLLYIPLLFVGYQLVNTKNQLRRIFGLMSLTVVVPALIGVIEAVLVYGGQAKLVYSLYGPAATAATQSFARQDYAAGGFSVRIPSIFSFGTQYFALTATMVAIVLAWRHLSGRRFLGAAIWILVVLAAFTSGARGAFIMVPLLILLTFVLQRRMRAGIMTGFGIVIIFLATASIFGADPSQVFSTATEVGVSEVQTGFVTGMVRAVQITTVGLGTGSATGSSRYALGDATNPNLAAAQSESWWVKIVLELGLPGLAIVVALLGWITLRGFAALRMTRDSALRTSSAVLLAFLIWNFVYFTKGAYIDLDPIDVYFWLFAGILARLPSIEDSTRRHQAPAEPARARRVLLT
jgi:hypothetical protein